MKVHSSAVWQEIRLTFAPEICAPSWKTLAKFTSEIRAKSAPKIYTKIHARIVNQYPQEPHNEEATKGVP